METLCKETQRSRQPAPTHKNYVVTSAPDHQLEEQLKRAFQNIWEMPAAAFTRDLAFQGTSTMVYHDDFLSSRRSLLRAMRMVLKHSGEAPSDTVEALQKKNVTSVYWRYLAEVSGASGLLDPGSSDIPRSSRKTRGLFRHHTAAFIARCIARLPDSFYTYAAVCSNNYRHDNTRRHQCYKSVYAAAGNLFALLFHWLRCFIDVVNTSYRPEAQLLKLDSRKENRELLKHEIEPPSAASDVSAHRIIEAVEKTRLGIQPEQPSFLSAEKKGRSKSQTTSPSTISLATRRSQQLPKIAEKLRSTEVLTNKIKLENVMTREKGPRLSDVSEHSITPRVTEKHKQPAEDTSENVNSSATRSVTASSGNRVVQNALSAEERRPNHIDTLPPINDLTREGEHRAQLTEALTDDKQLLVNSVKEPDTLVPSGRRMLMSTSLPASPTTCRKEILPVSRSETYE